MAMHAQGRVFRKIMQGFRGSHFILLPTKKRRYFVSARPSVSVQGDNTVVEGLILNYFCVTFPPRTSLYASIKCLEGAPNQHLHDSKTPTAGIPMIFKADDRGVLDVRRLRITQKITELRGLERVAPCTLTLKIQHYPAASVYFITGNTIAESEKPVQAKSFRHLSIDENRFIIRPHL